MDITSFKTIGVVGKRRAPGVAGPLRQLCEALRELGREVLLEDETATLLGDCVGVSRDVLARSCQLIIVVGGDGTLLDAGRSFAASGVPLLGVNQGRLGFLVDVRPADIPETLAALFRGEFLREARPLLEARVRKANGSLGEALLAVNDVVVRNQGSIRMIDFSTWLAKESEWEFICQHRADGVIVSTATGSTAYALSSGGPVVHPSLEAVALVPICPHTLSDRPIVVPAACTIRIALGRDDFTAAVTCDGQITVALEPDDTVEISRSPHALRLIHPRHYSYFELLRDKLHWGQNPVNTVE